MTQGSRDTSKMRMRKANSRTGLSNSRGLGLLAFAIATAMISSLAAYAALLVSLNQARAGRVLHERPRARYAAEAGLVIAKERLWRNAGDCAGAGLGGTAGVVQQIDTDGDGSGDTSVQIQWTNCGANGQHRITSTVVY